MVRKPIFDNQKMTEMMARYAKHPRSMKLRSQIMENIYPLIDAAIMRKRFFKGSEDLRQECALKVLKGLSKFDSERGSAFAFVWTVVCNMGISQTKRFDDKVTASFDTDPAVKLEVEGTYQAVKGPEEVYISGVSGGVLKKALDKRNILLPDRRRYRKACLYILDQIRTGSFFESKSKVYRALKRMGLKKKEARYCVDYVLVSVRDQLYEARRSISFSVPRQPSKAVPDVSGVGVPQDIWEGDD